MHTRERRILFTRRQKQPKRKMRSGGSIGTGRGGAWLRFALRQHAADQAVFDDKLVPEDHEQVTKNSRRQNPACADVDPLGSKGDAFDFADGVRHLPLAKQQHTKTTGHHVDVSADRHHEHRQIQGLFSAVNEGLFGCRQGGRPGWQLTHVAVQQPKAGDGKGHKADGLVPVVIPVLVHPGDKLAAFHPGHDVAADVLPGEQGDDQPVKQLCEETIAVACVGEGHGVFSFSVRDQFPSVRGVLVAQKIAKDACCAVFDDKHAARFRAVRAIECPF